MLNIRQEMAQDLVDQIIMMVDEDINEITTSRSSWITSMADVADNYLGVPEDRTGPWENSSNVHIPMTMIAVETTHPRIYTGLVGLDEMVTAQPQSGASVEYARDITGFLNWSLRSRTQINALPALDGILHTSETYGPSISKLIWEYRDRTTTKLYRRRRYKAEAGMMYQLMKSMKLRSQARQLEIPYQQHVAEIVGSRLLNFVNIDRGSDRTRLDFDFVLDGERREGHAEIPIPDPYDLDVDVFVTADTIIKNAPTLTQVPVTEFLAPVETNDIQDSKCNIHRYWLTLDELDEMQEAGTAYFDEDIWNTLVNEQQDTARSEVPHPGDPIPIRQATANESIARQKMQKALGDKEKSEVRRGYEVLECYYTFRMPGETRAREWVFFYLPDYNWIFRVVAMEVLCPTNKRPFTKWDFLRDDDSSFYSLGIGHIVMDLQAIINEIFNKQMDRDDLINMPFGFFRPSTTGAKDIIEISPGKLIPTADPTAINIPNWNRPNAADTPYIQLLLSMVERLTNATNYFQGSAPSRPNAPRTFGATAAIIQEGQINFGMHIARYQDALFDVCDSAKSYYRHFMDETVEFMAPGADTISKITPEVLDSNVGLIFKGTATNTNKAVMRELSAMVYMSLIQNPLIMTDPVALFNVTRRFAIAHEYLEFDQDVARPAPEMQHAPMDQMEEIEMMAMGQSIMPLPQDNHEEHMQVIAQFLQSEMVAGFPLEAVTLLTAHLQQHQQMAAMMQRAQMVQSPGADVNAGQVGASTGATHSESGEPANSPEASGTEGASGGGVTVV